MLWNRSEFKIFNWNNKDLKDDYYTIMHNCNSEPGSLGAPLINVNNNKVIGVHEGAMQKNRYNIGIFFKKAIRRISKKI